MGIGGRGGHWGEGEDLEWGGACLLEHARAVRVPRPRRLLRLEALDLGHELAHALVKLLALFDTRHGGFSLGAREWCAVKLLAVAGVVLRLTSAIRLS